MHASLSEPQRYTGFVMPKPSKLKLVPLPHSDESAGQRLARIRRERGFTQVELAEKTGLVQTLVSDYERGKLRLNADMILRFATALEVSTDDLLQPAGPRPSRKPSRSGRSRLSSRLHFSDHKILCLSLICTSPCGRRQRCARPRQHGSVYISVLGRIASGSTSSTVGSNRRQRGIRTALLWDADEEPGRCKPGCPSLPLAETTSVK